MKKLWAFFDYDDTLGGLEIAGEVVENSRAYFNAIDIFAEKYASGDVDLAVSLKGVQNKIDHLLCDIHGFESKTRFTESFLHTYEAFFGSPSDEEKEEIRKIGMSVWTHPYRALPGAEETLKAVAPNYNIGIVTKGNTEEQSTKLLDSGLFKYADRVWIVNRKDVDDWEGILRDTGLLEDEQLRTNSWAIGNSPKGDVNIPVEFGLNGILMTRYGTWSFEEAEAPNAHKVYDITEVLPFLTPIKAH